MIQKKVFLLILIGFVFILNSVNAQNLIGYWKFDESSGSIASDSSGYGNTGTLYGSLSSQGWISNCKSGNCLKFNGVNDYVDTTHETSWDFRATDDITIIAWINLSSDTPGTYGNIWGDMNGPCFQLHKQSSGSYTLNWFTQQEYQSNVLTYEMDTWYHVAVVREGSNNVKWYRNGQIINTNTALNEQDENPDFVGIGGDEGGEWFKGTMDEVKIYNRALTSDEILADYSGSVTTTTSSTTTTTPGTTTTTSTITSTTTSTIPAGQVSISGQLRNSTNIIQANVSVYNQGTNRINTSQITSGGNYNTTVWPGVYDLQYNILYISNFFIKLISVNIFSSLQNLVNYVNKIGNTISFSANITGNQEVQIYSDEMPNRILKNGTLLENVDSYLQLTNNKWYYNSSEKKLYILINPTVITTTTTTTVSTTTTSSTTTIPISADYYVIGSDGSYTATNSSGNIILTGSNAANVINFVLNMMKSGQKVEFQGTFDVSDKIIPKSDTTLFFGTSVINASASIPTHQGYIILIVLDYQSNITIDGGFFHGNGCQWAITGYMSNAITVQNAYFEGFLGSFGGGVIQLNNGNNHLVQYCKFENYGNAASYDDRFSAVALNNCGNSRILHNYVDCGKKAAGLGAWSQGQGNNEIAYNFIKDWSNLFNHAIYVGGTPDCSIHDNEATAPNTDQGGAIVAKSKAFIYNNYVHDVNAWGIAVYWVEGGAAYGNPAGSRIYNNTVTNVWSTGIAVSSMYGPATDIIISGNVISGEFNGYPTTGLHVENAISLISNVTFQLNTVSNMTYGARFDYNDMTPLPTNTVNFLANRFINVGSAFRFGSSHPEIVDTTIAYNDFTEANTNALLQDTGTNTMVYDNIPSGWLPDKNVPVEKIPPPQPPP